MRSTWVRVARRAAFEKRQPWPVSPRRSFPRIYVRIKTIQSATFTHQAVRFLGNARGLAASPCSNADGARLATCCGVVEKEWTASRPHSVDGLRTTPVVRNRRVVSGQPITVCRMSNAGSPGGIDRDPAVTGYPQLSSDAFKPELTFAPAAGGHALCLWRNPRLPPAQDSLLVARCDRRILKSEYHHSKGQTPGGRCSLSSALCGLRSCQDRCFASTLSRIQQDCATSVFRAQLAMPVPRLPKS